MSPSKALAGTYDYRLVALSVLISTFASYAALDLGGRVTASRGTVRSLWLMGGAAAMGMGIWSMHYIGMLAADLMDERLPLLHRIRLKQRLHPRTVEVAAQSDSKKKRYHAMPAFWEKNP